MEYELTTWVTDFTVSSNYIGGKAAQCGGEAWSKSNTANSPFHGIYLNVETSVPSNIQGNVIRNFNWTNSSNANWTGINIAAGAANIGTTTGNTIGADTGTSSIIFTGGTYTGAPASFYGIYIASTNTVNCQNNILGSVITGRSSDSYAANFYGIYKTNKTESITIK